MTVCDSCKRLERYRVVLHYTFGLHQNGKPCDGTYLSFDLHLCPDCKQRIGNEYAILNCWKNLCGEPNQ
jgi:hypothetical protein